MPVQENVVNVSREWLNRVEALLKSLEAQIKVDGIPVRPGFFRVDLTNETEVTLKGVIRDIAINTALEKAIKEQEQANEPDPPQG